MSRRAQQSGGGLTDRLPIGRAAGLGAAAYVVGYAVTWLFTEIDDEIDFGSSDAETIDVVGWFFYSTHHVDIVATQNGETESYNIFGEASDLMIPEPIWYLIPIVLLGAAGYLAAAELRGREATTQNAAIAGATVIAGYLPLAAAGTFLFEYETEQTIFGQTISTSISIDQTMGIVLAGIAFPLVLGAIGGVIYAAQSSGGSNRRGAGADRRRQP